MVVFLFTTKNCLHGIIPWEIEKSFTDPPISPKTLSYGEKIVKISLVDPEIIGLELKKKEIMVGKYIAWSASLPSVLKNLLAFPKNKFFILKVTALVYKKH